MSKYNSIEEATEVLKALEENYKQFQDEEYNLNEEINKSKQDLRSITSLQEEQRKNNYSIWSQLPMIETQVKESEVNQPTIQTIVEGIDI